MVDVGFLELAHVWFQIDYDCFYSSRVHRYTKMNFSLLLSPLDMTHLSLTIEYIQKKALPFYSIWGSVASMVHTGEISAHGNHFTCNEESH